jgi:Tetratricopeptide repeat
MSRRLSWLAVIFLVVIGPSAVLSQSSRFEDLAEQAEQAYCSEQFSRAIELSLQALEANTDEDFKDVAIQLATLAGSNEKLRDYAATERYYARALALAEQRFGKDSINSTFFMEALARALIRNGRVDEAADIYDRVIAIRAKMIVDGFDAFKARHIANAGRVALTRKRWRQAFDTYVDAVSAIDERVAQLSSGDSLADLSSEMNNSTFVGLAQAAWELGKVQGEDAAVLMNRSFEALQAKWRTAAAFALRQAAERGTKESVRPTQDRGELIAQLEAEREDLNQAWFRKREQDPAYHEVSQRLSQEGANLSPETVLGGFREQQAQSEELLAEYEKCGAKLTAECQANIKRLQAGVDAAMAALMKTGASYQVFAQQLSEMEKGLEGYDEWWRKSTEIQEKIAALSEAGSTEAPSHITPSGLTPTAKPLPLDVSEVQALLHDDEALVTFIVGEDEGFVWEISRDDAMWSPVDLNDTTLDQSVSTLRSALEPPSVEGVTPSPETGRVPFSLPLAHELYAKLLGPVEKLIAGKRHLILFPLAP